MCRQLMSSAGAIECGQKKGMTAMEHDQQTPEAGEPEQEALPVTVT